MITKIKLVNWRSHLNSELEFTKGTNALLGHIGSGKSSILDSICFALFGTFPMLQTKKLKLDEIIMNKPIEKDRAEVEIFFQVDGKQYSVRRVIEKNKGTTYSEIRENGKLLEAPNTQRVNEIAEKTLKIDYELFSKAVYSEQNALDYFLILPKGQRMKKIDELLMIDKFEKARANSTSLSNKLIERKLGKQSVLERTNIIKLENTVNELKQSLNKILADKGILEKELQSTLSGKSKMEKELGELSRLIENLQTLKAEENALSSVSKEISMSLESLERSVKGVNPETVEKELKNLNRVIQEFEIANFEKQKQYQKLQEQSSRAKAEVEVLKREKIQRLETEIEEQLRIKKEFDGLKKEIGGDVDAKLDQKKLELEKFVGEVEALKIKIKDMQDTLDQLSSLGAKCPICERRLTEEKKIILYKQKKMQIENLMDSLSKAVKKREASSKDLKSLEIAAKKLDEMIIEIKDLDELKTELENHKDIFIVLSESSVKLTKELKQLEVELEELQRKFKDTIDRKRDMEIMHLRSKDYSEKNKRLVELMNKRQIILTHMAELESSLIGKEISKSEEEVRKLIATERELTTKISGFNELFKEKKNRLEDFENALSLLTNEKSEIQKLDEITAELQIFGTALELAQVELRKEFIQAVNYAMSNIWQTLYPYQDFPNIRLSIEEGDYLLQLQSRIGDWGNVEGIASGGERSLAALTLRIAFSLVLAPQLRLLILDEPTVNLDTKAISELATTLRERIGDFINQTFLITHTPELEDAVNGMAYKLERDKSIDSPTKIIQLN